jgi:hypothetical protein
MNKPKQQGTAWETSLVNQAQEVGLMAGRFPEGGMHDVGDVWINDLPRKAGYIPAVAWSRLVKQDGSRRHADGERTVVVIALEDFLKICAWVDLGFVIECKATERLNVTRELHNAKNKLRRWKER